MSLCKNSMELQFWLHRAGRKTVSYFAPSFDQCIFGKEIRVRVNSTRAICSHLKGIALWCIWIFGNKVVYSKEHWNDTWIHNQVWNGLI